MLQSSSFKKKIGRTSKNLYFWTQLLVKKKICMGHAQNEKKKLHKYISKSEYKLSKLFILPKCHKFWQS